MLKIITIPVTLYEQNARILIDDSSKEAVIVDPGGDVPNILAQLPNDVTLKAIWITHSHIDHVSGVGALLNEFDQGSIDVVAHAEDKINRENLPLQSQMMQFPYSGEFDTTQDCGHEDVLSLGQYNFKVLHTPGHAIGHVSFYCDNMTNEFNVPICIAGDALFRGSIGRTDLPGGNHQQLLDSIQTQLFVLPENTLVFSGHGPNTTIGEEKESNPFFS
ncbi:MBL fold metallo-hydrolase [Candidatus Marinamargulisbacteria bacterium SCGC AG-343-K17]|nr:MBL fold metallo-hydrolase [Candidatus Marinamargulisbacteria bacterium SCGC AG-343-K17]